MMHDVIAVIAGLIFFIACALFAQMVIAQRGEQPPRLSLPHGRRSAVRQRTNIVACSRCGASTKVYEDLWVRYGVCGNCYRSHLVQKLPARSSYHSSGGAPMWSRMLDEARGHCAERSGRGSDDDSGCWDNVVRAYEDR